LQCELACSLDNEGAFNPSKSRIRVFKFEDEGRFVPYTCTQCAEAWCLKACPVDAISLDPETGAKVVSDALCVGCKVCTTGKVIKCDLCEGEPECATACPTDAITYIDANWTGLERMRAWAQRTDAGAGAAE
jgi:Fe-S-cluster-containing hydrogenase component 2